MSPLTEQQAMEIARQAKLELPQTEAAFEALEKQFYEDILSTSIEQVDKRERLFMAIRVCRTVKGALLSAALHADIADMRTLVAETGLTRPQ